MEKIFVKEQRGIKIAFLSYMEEDLGEEAKKYISIYEKEKVKNEIEKAKQENDFVCVIMHWKESNTNIVKQENKDIVDFLISSGANMILGSNTGNVQKMEVKQNSDGEDILVAYSLGNFMSQYKEKDNNTEMLLTIKIRKNAENGSTSLAKVDYTPIYMIDKGKDAKDRFCLIDMKQEAINYTNGKQDLINKETYDILIEQINKLERIIKE